VQGAQDLSLLLRAGALPAPLTIIEERSVGPGLGADSIAAGKIASTVGMTLVIAFMIIAYGRFGLMADIALIANIILIAAALSLLQATLTLPGIAGIVLTIGMAVDANVLVFERIREEMRAGRTPISSIDAGYSRAITTIIDANVTTLIAAVLLYQFGSGPVRGFAVTLAIGIITSLFTAIMLTRLMVATWLKKSRPDTLPI
jgi:preprotein translocase subunit SecD